MKMSRTTASLSLLFLFAFLLQSCSAIAGIFKAGVWVGVLGVGGVVLLIIFLISRRN